MLIARHVFWKLQEIIRANPKIQKNNMFYSWLGGAYVTDLLIKIRRQGAPHRKDDISFSRFFYEIEQNPEILSWRRFSNLYRGSAVKDLARRDFKKFYGWPEPVKQEFINLKMVKKDHKTLNKIIERLKRYTDKRVAHISTNRIRFLLKFDDLNPALDYLEKLIIKYELIFNAGNYGDSIFPSGGEDWVEIFRVPWIIESTKKA